MTGGPGASGVRPEWTARALERIRGGGPATLLVGLTGGVGTGKSTVGGMLLEMGVPVLDADAIVHELLGAGGGAVQSVVARFGAEMRDDAGAIDRKKLGALVFRDEAARRDLEAIVHPKVIEESERRFHDIVREQEASMVVYDAALLVETGRYRGFDRLVVVGCHREIQLQRLMDRGELSADEAGARIRAQMPIEKKAELADYVIDNSGPWHLTRRRVETLHRSLRSDAAALHEALAG